MILFYRILVILIIFQITSINIYSQTEERGFGSLSSKEWQFIYKKPLSLQPELTEYYWELERPPFGGTHDKIGLHRIVNENATPKAAVFICPGTNASTWRYIGNDFIGNTINSINIRLKQNSSNKKELMDLLDDANTMKQRLLIRFLAAKGYDVYGIDYRTRYIPTNYETKDLEFMTNWGWDLFVEDTKAAIEKTKKLSGYNKVFIAGTSFGGMLATTYSSKYWHDDLNGIVLLDGGNGGRWKIRIPLELWKLIENELIKALPDLPDWAYTDGRISPKILQVLIDTFIRNILYKLVNMYAIDMQVSLGPLTDVMDVLTVFLNTIGIPFHLGELPHYNDVTNAAFSDPLAKPIDPVTGIYLKPYNETTGKPFDSYLKWNAERLYLLPLEGLFTNYVQGHNTPLGAAINFIGNDRFWPLEVYLETVSMFEFEITTSAEPLNLIGFTIDISQIPAAVTKAINILLSSTNVNNEVNKSTNTKNILMNLLNNGHKNISQTFDYVGNLKNVDVPLISFQSRLGLLVWGPFNPGIKNKDVVNGGEYPYYGHMDIYTGLTNPENVNIPLLKWLDEHVLNY